jgi:hyperosmotically inducible periplasmic protein
MHDTTRGPVRTSAVALLALACATVLAACGSTGGVPASEARAAAIVDDTAVTSRVKAALVDDPLTQAHRIDVETQRGIVQLSGFVDTAEQKERATAVARGIAGVRDVNNELELRSR